MAVSAYRHAVIISSYNRPQMVRTAIQSVLLSRASVQLIVADDDSNEETMLAISAEICGRKNAQSIRAKRPREGEFTNITRRATACINDALKLVDAEFVHYLPDDDWFASGRFYAFERFFDANPDADVAYGRMGIVRNGHLEPHTSFLDCITNDPVNWVDHGQFSHRSRVLTRVPKWPVTPHYAFDANYFLALVAAGYWFHPVNAVVNYKTHHDRNLMTERDRDSPPSDRE
jgi:glycosyltransferase involved in cell wall biosynthesis